MYEINSYIKILYLPNEFHEPIDLQPSLTDLTMVKQAVNFNQPLIYHHY